MSPKNSAGIMSKSSEANKSVDASGSALGKAVGYEANYNPDLLFPISRKAKREEIGINDEALPFHGFDCWNHYEVSWLNEKGKPMVAIAEIIYNCTSPRIVESKSMKLYFNSLNNTHYASIEACRAVIENDLCAAVEAPVRVNLHVLATPRFTQIQAHLAGECFDDLDIACDTYMVNPDYLRTSDTVVEESLHTHLLKSNCLVTGQPDWASCQIDYCGPQIDREGLLQYIVSYRNHNEFHEQCIERIFADIMRYCKPTSLTVSGRYTRRGGLDINPYRSTETIDDALALNQRLVRQ